MVKHNNIIPNIHCRKKYCESSRGPLKVRLNLNQAGKKKSRRLARAAKAAAIAAWGLPVSDLLVCAVGAGEALSHYTKIEARRADLPRIHADNLFKPEIASHRRRPIRHQGKGARQTRGEIIRRAERRDLRTVLRPHAALDWGHIAPLVSVLSPQSRACPTIGQ